MPTIKFTIDNTEHSTEVSGNHPNQVYRKGDEVVKEIADLGYEYIGDPPSVQDLADADRLTGENEVLDLGEIDDQVKPISGSSDSGTTHETGPE